ncbi:MAG: hypothetical protein IJD95_06420 [Clostridia bacterium]|nr:hypothetical protein [Clostridia bacterium]
MKKIISIMISVTLLLICLSGCGNSFKQGNVVISDDAKVVGDFNGESLYMWRAPLSFGNLNARYTNADALSSSILSSSAFVPSESIIFKGTVVGDAIQLGPKNEEIDLSIYYKKVLYLSSLVIPVKVEEVYYTGNDLTMEVNAGDIVYVYQGLCRIFTDEFLNLEFGGNLFEEFKKKTNASAGDLWTEDPSPYKKELLLQKGETYLIFIQEVRGEQSEFDPEGHFFCSMSLSMMSIFCLSKEPGTPEENGVTSEREIRIYNRYLQIRKDAIDYYINGNK